MRQYLDLLQDILDNGVQKSDRTGTGTISVFGRQMRFDLSKGFPLLTTKKLHIKSILGELLWFLSGSTHIKPLLEQGINIWTPDAFRWYKTKAMPDQSITTVKEYTEAILNHPRETAAGDLGPIYSAQWRSWEKIDQIQNLIDQIKTNPDSRRHLVSAWNVGELDQMALPPCHYAFQCYVENGKLSLMFQMRSVDTFLGLPFNIASYAFLAHMIAHVCNLEVGELIWTGGDVHIYNNHIEQVKLQLTREPFPLAQLKFVNPVMNIDDFTAADFDLVGYQSHEKIKGDVSVG